MNIQLYGFSEPAASRLVIGIGCFLATDPEYRDKPWNISHNSGSIGPGIGRDIVVNTIGGDHATCLADFGAVEGWLNEIMARRTDDVLKVPFWLVSRQLSTAVPLGTAS